MKEKITNLLRDLQTVPPGVISDSLRFDLDIHPSVIPLHRDSDYIFYPEGLGGGFLCGFAFNCNGDLGDGDDKFRVNMLDQVNSGDIQVLGGGGVIDVAYYGDISARLAQSRGIVGALIDGYCRDFADMPDNFPVISRGPCVHDAYNRWTIKEVGKVIKFGNIYIEHGDILHVSPEAVIVIDPDILEDLHHFSSIRKESEEQIRDRIIMGDSPREIYDSELRW